MRILVVYGYCLRLKSMTWFLCYFKFLQRKTWIEIDWRLSGFPNWTNKEHDLPFSRLTKLNMELCFWSCHKSKLLCSRRYDHMCRVLWYHGSHQQCACVNKSDHYNFLENVMELSSLLTWERNDIWSHSYSADKRQNKLKKAYYSTMNIFNRKNWLHYMLCYVMLCIHFNCWSM